ncbi:histidine kinase [Vallitalea pronyensis]|uniref:Histidine kinase n=1 Tax=Vallitalea pronyensis TaxID=1348613 RepID=A0A8J8SIP0_9FIRM|nr:sensor histidine kinase [Vallitalea pronyensis]QUI24806.1 histidine kinase [Vallitalea pronyensis]
MKLQYKYFVLFFALFVIVSIGITLTISYLTNIILVKNYKKMNEESLNFVVRTVDKEVEQLISSINAITSNSVVIKRIQTNYRFAKPEDILNDDHNVSNTIASMSTYNLFRTIQAVYMKGINGEVYQYGFGTEFDEDNKVEERIYGEDFKDNKLKFLGVERTYYRLNENAYVMKFAQKMYNNLGENIGWIYFEMNESFFADLFVNEKLNQHTKLYLIDHNNKIMYSNDNYIKGMIFQMNPLDGVYTERGLKNFQWKLISETPRDYISKDSELTVRVTIITAIVSIILEMFFVFIITRELVKPIKRLTNGMKEVRNGNLDIQIHTTSQDEIGELTDSFNEMTRDIKTYLQRRIEDEKAIKDAEYQALQAQINPHFMYNSLNTLRWLATLQEADNIVDVIDSLWTLLHNTSHIQDQFVNLKKEIEIIDAYCTIQQVRYRGKFDIEYNIEDEHYNIVVPKYILQPIVENAIFHGIGPKKALGLIEVKTYTMDHDLYIEVMDDGVGMDEKTISQIMQSNTTATNKRLNNIGVNNVNDRLKLLYGESYGLVINSELGLKTTVTIKIPIKNNGVKLKD